MPSEARGGERADLSWWQDLEGFGGLLITKLCTVGLERGAGVQLYAGLQAPDFRARFGLENANTRGAGVDAALVNPFEVARGAVTDHPAPTK